LRCARPRACRTDQGYTIVDLTSAVGCSEGTIRQLENDNVKGPHFALGVRLSNTLNVDSRFLALGETYSTRERFEVLEARVAQVESRLAALAPKRR
jgi:transcriptional regulator with XRE-family HTH domain